MWCHLCWANWGQSTNMYVNAVCAVVDFAVFFCLKLVDSFAQLQVYIVVSERDELKIGTVCAPA